ncbi:hypothetical protein HD554DRAFT_2040651 [Boletus coccyginus]|nr:hypothetical protein HD554DRAFT_2040651 [Boletus coccyginus]
MACALPVVTFGLAFHTLTPVLDGNTDAFQEFPDVPHRVHEPNSAHVTQDEDPELHAILDRIKQNWHADERARASSRRGRSGDGNIGAHAGAGVDKDGVGDREGIRRGLGVGIVMGRESGLRCIIVSRPVAVKAYWCIFLTYAQAFNTMPSYGLLVVRVPPSKPGKGRAETAQTTSTIMSTLCPWHIKYDLHSPLFRVAVLSPPPRPITAKMGQKHEPVFCFIMLNSIIAFERQPASLTDGLL